MKYMAIIITAMKGVIDIVKPSNGVITTDMILAPIRLAEMYSRLR